MKNIWLGLLIITTFFAVSCDDDSVNNPLSWNFTANFSGDITYKMSTILGTATKIDEESKITLGGTDVYNGKNISIAITTFGTTAKTYNVDLLGGINECSCVVIYDGVEYLATTGKVILSSVGSSIKGTFEFKCYDLDGKPLNINSGSFYLKLL
jgi:hypothetical protein